MRALVLNCPYVNTAQVQTEAVKRDAKQLLAETSASSLVTTPRDDAWKREEQRLRAELATANELMESMSCEMKEAAAISVVHVSEAAAASSAQPDTAALKAYQQKERQLRAELRESKQQLQAATSASTRCVYICITRNARI